MQNEELFNQVREEIKLIHSVYDSGNKSIKPSFRFIAVSLDTDDFIVAKTLAVIQEKLLSTELNCVRFLTSSKLKSSLTKLTEL